MSTEANRRNYVSPQLASDLDTLVVAMRSQRLAWEALEEHDAIEPENPHDGEAGSLAYSEAIYGWKMRHEVLQSEFEHQNTMLTNAAQNVARGWQSRSIPL